MKEFDVQIERKIREDVSALASENLLDIPAQENWLKKHALEPLVRSAIIEPSSVLTQFLPEPYQPKNQEAQKRSANSNSLAENLTETAFTMAGAAVVYGGMAIITKGASASLAERGLLHKTVARALTSTTGSMIAGAAIYDVARKPHEGETRLGNTAAGVAGFAVFGAGNHLIANTGLAIKLAAMPAIGAIGGLVQRQTSIGLTEHRWLNSTETEQAAVQGALLNTMMPLASKGISRLLERKAAPTEASNLSQNPEEILRQALPIIAENRQLVMNQMRNGPTAPWIVQGEKGFAPNSPPDAIPKTSATKLILEQSSLSKRQVVPAIRATENKSAGELTAPVKSRSLSMEHGEPALKPRSETSELIQPDKASGGQLELVGSEHVYKQLTLEIKLERDKLGSQLFEQLDTYVKPKNLYTTLDILKGFSEDSRIPERTRVATMHEIQKLVEPKTVGTKLSQLERAKIGSDILDNVRLPDLCIKQLGGTCVIASYEVRLASLYPEKYAELIRQVATTGKYHALDGSITPVPLNSLSNSKTHYTANHASRIFQVTAPNLAWQQAVTRPDGTPVSPGSLVYEMPGRKTFLKDYSTDPEGSILLNRIGQTIDSPHLDRAAQKLIDDKIVGRSEIFQITRQSALEVPGNFYFRDMAHLREFLSEVSQGKRKDARFPLLIDVDANLIQQGIKIKYGAEPEMNHAATLLSFDAKAGKVELNNTWGNRSGDYVRENALTVEQLYTVVPRPKLNEVLASQ